ncbi:hypothetical protein niasHT_027734 [Heterodera trifolii]|uniref:BTB domain-containing protein n=1 Tax=Heterodera trifolii TaxID=157864 RepID=A0ABD2KIZ5_9BILA
MSSLSKQGNSNERMKHLLSSGEDADVHFLVGDGKELLHAHKLILKHGSDVFEAMFRFDSQNAKAGRGKGKTRKKPSKFNVLFFVRKSKRSTRGTRGKSAAFITLADSPVEVPDVEPSAFRVMLSFIYSDDLSELDGDNAMAVLYAGKNRDKSI